MNVTIKSFLSYAVNKIKDKLNTKQLVMFENICFTHFLRANELQFSRQIVNQLLWRQCVGHDMEIIDTTKKTPSSDQSDWLVKVISWSVHTFSDQISMVAGWSLIHCW